MRLIDPRCIAAVEGFEERQLYAKTYLYVVDRFLRVGHVAPDFHGVVWNLDFRV
jgi:hypothetical protein